MSERVEEIRRRHADDLAMLAKNPRLVEKEWSDHPESWRDTADVRDLLTALAQAEREREDERRLRVQLSEDSQRHLDQFVAARAALERIANHPHQSYPDNCGPYEIGVSDGHRCAANEARAALEGRG